MAKKKLDAENLEAIANSALQNAATYSDGVIANERAEAWEYFNGEPFGNEMPGRSQVVTRDVFESVMWTMPSLVRIFMAGDDIVKFEPRTEGDDEAAEQATEYCNYVVRQQNDGFNLLYTMFMDALIQKNGVVKVVWDERKIPETEEYEGLSAEQVAMLQGEGWEIVKAESRPDVTEGAEAEAEMMAAAGMQIPMLYDVKVKREKDKSQVRLYGTPPEELLVTRGTRSINEDDGGVFHRRRVAASDLIAEGYKREDVDGLPSDDNESGFSPESLARYEDQDYPDDNTEDFSARKVWVTECYLRVDMDGDGITELRKITIAGGSRGNGKLLVHPDEGEAPEVQMIPFASVCPIPLPHRYYGLSLADITMDLQKIHSTIFRQSLDSLYLANNPRYFVNGRVNLDDLLTSRPGGIVRGEGQQSMVTPLNTDFVGAASFPMIDMIDRKRQSRTGVSKYGVGVDAEKLSNESATASNNAAEAANERIELTARIFAETGITRLFRLILHTSSKHATKPAMIRLRDKYVEADPREWEDRFDMSVRVGLGTGNKDRTTAQLGMFGQLLALVRQDPETRPMITAEKVYNYLEDVVENAGLKRIERYAVDPRTIPPPQPQPNPEAQKAQAEMQLKQAELQGKQQQAQMELQAKQQADQAKAQTEMQMSQQEAQLKARLAQQDAQLKMQLAREAAQAQAEIERYKAELAAQVEREKSAAQIEADRERMAIEFEIKRQQMAEEFAFRRQELGMEALLEEKKMDAGSRDGQGDINVSD